MLILNLTFPFHGYLGWYTRDQADGDECEVLVRDLREQRSLLGILEKRRAKPTTTQTVHILNGTIIVNSAEKLNNNHYIIYQNRKHFACHDKGTPHACDLAEHG